MPSRIRMRIAAIIGTSDFTGGSRVVLGYLDALPRDRMEVVTCICPPRPDGIARGVAQEASKCGFEVAVDPGVEEKVPFIRAIDTAKRLRALRIDTLVASNVQNAFRYAALIRLFMPGTKLLVIANNRMTFRGWRRLHFLKRAVYFALLRRVPDMILFASQALLDDATRGRGAQPPNFRVLFNSVDTTALAPDVPARAEVRSRIMGSFCRDQTDAVIVLYSARVSQQKDVLTFAQVAGAVVRRSANVHFFLAGEAQTDEDREYAALVEGRVAFEGVQGNVHFLGWRDDVRDLLEAADIYLATARWEGLPLGIVEAMALEKPVVTTSFASASEVVEDGVNGFICPIAAVDALAERVLYLSGDPGLRLQMGRLGRRTAVERFDSAAANAGFADALERLGNRT